MKAARGLTLVELLVALFILSVLAVLSFRSLAAMTEVEARLTGEGRRFERLVEAVDLFERDLSLAAGDGDGFFRGDGGEATRFGELRFARGGSNYLAGDEAGTQRLGYRFRAGRLEKLVYPPVWVAGGAPEVRPLLADGELRGLYLRFRDRAGQWHAQWPAAGTSGLPGAVEARFLTAADTEIRRIYLLR